MSSAAPSRSTQRKRNRKRKRRNVSSDSSSSSSSQSSGSEDENQSGPSNTKPAVTNAPPDVDPDSSDEDDSDSSSSAGGKDAEEVFESEDEVAGANAASKATQKSREESPHLPQQVPLPSYIDSQRNRDETALRDTFRKHWMSSMAGAFAADLEQIRKEPNLTPSRLGLLIDSLASGADVYARTKDDGTMDVDDAQIVLDGKQ